MLAGVRRRLQVRRARRLRANARALGPSRLGRTVDRLAATVEDGTGEARLVAVEGLAAVARAGVDADGPGTDRPAAGGLRSPVAAGRRALARLREDADDGTGRSAGDGGDGGGRPGGDEPGRGGDDADRAGDGGDAGESGEDDAALHPVRDRAFEALVGALGSEDDGVVAAVSPELRLVVAARPGLAGRVDDAYAAALDAWDRGAHRRVATDVGLLVGEAGTDLDPPLPAAQAALRDCLTGPADVAEAAGTAYVLAAASPDAVADPEAVGEGLAVLASDLEGTVPGEDRLRRYAGDRDLRATARLLSDGERPDPAY